MSIAATMAAENTLMYRKKSSSEKTFVGAMAVALTSANDEITVASPNMVVNLAIRVLSDRTLRFADDR
jgi:hypothetical protein